jgi:hypothetical protein
MHKSLLPKLLLKFHAMNPVFRSLVTSQIFHPSPKESCGHPLFLPQTAVNTTTTSTK